MQHAYYNENDPVAAAMLRGLIADGLIAPGDVDERSIVDVQPADLVGYRQCHFFAGIGGWSFALRLAGIPDDFEVWTGSCPCQPFSVAGKRKGDKDERHLWPEFKRLIEVGRPPITIGEQVASKDGREWLAGVRADLEALGYEVGAADLCAASAGAPHIRQRLYWMAVSASERDRAHPFAGSNREGKAQGREFVAGGQCADVGGVEHAASDGRLERRAESGRRLTASGCGEARRLVDAAHAEGERQRPHRPSLLPNEETSRTRTSDAWSDFRIVECTDGKLRRIPTEPSLFPLAHGALGRRHLLHGAGNAIVPQLAATFIAASLEAIYDTSN